MGRLPLFFAVTVALTITVATSAPADTGFNRRGCDVLLTGIDTRYADVELTRSLYDHGRCREHLKKRLRILAGEDDAVYARILASLDIPWVASGQD